MAINDFITKNADTIRTDVIGNLEKRFSSHKLIQKFPKRFESDYIDFFTKYGKKGTFRIVHSQIARSISKNKNILNIEKTRRIRDENIFGDITENQEWEKI